MQTLEEGISSAAKAVEHSIKHGQPLDFVDTRPVTDLLNEIGSSDLSALEPALSGVAKFPKPSASVKCLLLRPSPRMSFGKGSALISVWELQQRKMRVSNDCMMREGTFDKDKAEQQIDAARAEVDALKGTAYVPRTNIITVQDLLGISEDLSAEGLLVKASSVHLKPLKGLSMHHTLSACMYVAEVSEKVRFPEAGRPDTYNARNQIM